MESHRNTQHVASIYFLFRRVAWCGPPAQRPPSTEHHRLLPCHAIGPTRRLAPDSTTIFPAHKCGTTDGDPRTNGEETTELTHPTHPCPPTTQEMAAPHPQPPTSPLARGMTRPKAPNLITIRRESTVRARGTRTPRNWPHPSSQSRARWTSCPPPPRRWYPSVMSQLRAASMPRLLVTISPPRRPCGNGWTRWPTRTAAWAAPTSSSMAMVMLPRTPHRRISRFWIMIICRVWSRRRFWVRCRWWSCPPHRRRRFSRGAAWTCRRRVRGGIPSRRGFCRAWARRRGERPRRRGFPLNRGCRRPKGNASIELDWTFSTSKHHFFGGQ